MSASRRPRLAAALLAALLLLPAAAGAQEEGAQDVAQGGAGAALLGVWEGRWLQPVDGGVYRTRLVVERVADGVAEAVFRLVDAPDAPEGRRLRGTAAGGRLSFDLPDEQRLLLRPGGAGRLYLRLVTPRQSVYAVLTRAAPPPQAAARLESPQAAARLESPQAAARPEPTQAAARPEPRQAPDRAEPPRPAAAAPPLPPEAATETAATEPETVTPDDLAALGLAVPLPEPLAMEPPSAGVPPGLAALAGVWAGRWSSGADAALVVESVRTDGASVGYAVGAAQGVAGGFAQRPAAWRDGLLTVDLGAGQRATFMRTGPGVLDATLEWPAGRAYGTFLLVRRPAPAGTAD